MSRRGREALSSSSSQESSPIAKHLKMAEEENEGEIEESVAKNKAPTLDMIFTDILMKVQDNTNVLMEDNKKTKIEFEELKKALEYQTTTVDNLTKENFKLKKSLKQQDDQINMLNEAVKEMKVKAEELEDLQDNMHQYQRKHNVEIHGIPERKGED